MPGRITRVRLRDYRSIAYCDVELQPLTILVGPNGSGKSNFLDSLRFLVHCMHAPLDDALDARSGLKSILRKMPDGGQAAHFSIEVEFILPENKPGLYALEVGLDPQGVTSITKETCEWQGGSFVIEGNMTAASSVPVPGLVRDRPKLVAFGSQSAFMDVFNLIAGMTFYSPDPEKMRKPTVSGPGRVLSRDASNAADVWARLTKEQPGIVDRVDGYVHSLNPAFSGVVPTEANGYRWLAFRAGDTLSHLHMNSSDVSAGTLRAVAILLAVFQVRGSGAPTSLIGLEEPENGLHPAAAGILLDALLEASATTPIIATTHWADMLDRKSVPADSIRVVAMQGGETIIGPINEAGRSILRKGLYSAGELMRNNELAPENSAVSSR